QKVFDLLICFYSVYSLKFKRWRFVLFSFQRAIFVISLRGDFIILPRRLCKSQEFFKINLMSS
ncbi:hypothetical protein ACIQD3_21300, partial [Peribacillus loiseleuriae]|uniref:hypothetical protein n=1 Tax=Peribacillus loiseleuriae TaxID=1679170 RepID=UPI00381DAEDD